MARKRLNYLHSGEYYIYYYRRAIPKRHQKAFKGRREIKLSLGTRDNREASYKVHCLNMQFERFFMALEGKEMSQLPKDLDISSVLGFSLKSITLPSGVKLEGVEVDSNNPQDVKEFNSLIANLNMGAKATSSTSSNDTAVAPDDICQTRFSTVVEEFFAHNSDYTPKTLQTNRAIFDLFIELYGDIPMSKFSHRIMSDFANTIRDKIPSNHSKNFSDIPIKELIALDHSNHQMMSLTNVNKYISRMSVFFTFAINHGYITENFASGKKFPVKKAKQEEGKPFTTDELKRLFEQSDLFQNNTPAKGNERKFWMPLIALYSGMRIGEIAQLRVEDITEENDDGISTWCFDINTNGHNKKLKNRSSKRIVPIHPELIKIGLLDYVKQRKSNGQLWDIKWDKLNGWGGNPSRRINYYLQHQAKVANCLHGLRHNVADALMKNEAVEKGWQEALLGHSQQGESYGRYGKGFRIATLLKTVTAIQYPQLDLRHLYANANK